ncbi:MAG: cell wall-binding repeat-containing protein [Actinobacteria bacterium]|nr:cell wall-binding repeat-containing protein [Actinomycetota bacterium]
MQRAWWLVVLACLLVATPVSGASGERVVERLAGDTRIDTAAAIATRAFPDGAPRVYLARADVLADAVAAGSLRDGPVLLIPSCDGVPSVVHRTIARIDPDRVTALGGTSALCDETLEAVAGSERPTDRLAGASRIETAATIARRSFPMRADSVYLARADELADAVAAGALTDGPVLLVPSCAGVPAIVSAEIDRLDPSRVFALGGEAAVCERTLVQAARGRTRARLAGPTRTTTAVAISEHEFPAGATAVYLARADGLADAVAAGILTGGPILLVPSCGSLPAAVAREIGRLDPDRIVVLGGEEAVCTATAERTRDVRLCRTAAHTNRGPATVGVAVTAAVATPAGPWVVTRHREPAVAAHVDTLTGRVSQVVQMPTIRGAWAATAHAGAVYVGGTDHPDLYRIDRARGVARRVARVAGERQFWDLTTSPDGRIYGGTFPGGAVFEYDPLQATTRSWPQVVAGQEYVRSIAATRQHVFAGIGPEAALVRIDRVTNEQVHLAEEQLRGEAFVYDLAVEASTVVAGTWPSGLLVTLDTENPDDVEVVRAETGARAAISTITLAGREVFFTTRSGRLWRYDLDTEELRQLAHPLDAEETRALFVELDTITGVGGSGVIWTYDRASGATEVRGLAEIGLEPGPEPAQSLLVRGTKVHVGGHWQLDVLDLESGQRHQHRAPGEPKVLAAASDAVLAALYPDGELWRLDGTGSPQQLTLRVGDAQIRPRDIEVVPGTGRIVIATQPDYGRLGGALAVIDPGRGPVVLKDVIPWQGVRALTSDGGVLLLGSEIWGGIGAEPLAREAVVGAYRDLSATPEWDLVPVPGATAIVGLEVVDGHPVGVTDGGIVFTIDPSVPEVVWRVDVGASVRAMTVADGYLHVATAAGVVRVNPWTTVTATVLAGDATAVAARTRGCGLVAVVDRDLLVGRV